MHLTCILWLQVEEASEGQSLHLPWGQDIIPGKSNDSESLSLQEVTGSLLPRKGLERRKFPAEVASRTEAFLLSHKIGEAQTTPEVQIQNWWASPSPGCWGQEQSIFLQGSWDPLSSWRSCLKELILTSSNPPAGPDRLSLPPSWTVTERGHKVHTKPALFSAILASHHKCL